MAFTYATSPYKYTDLDLNFGKNARTSDVNILTDEMAIKKSVFNLVMTHHGERPFHSEIGCLVHNLLFDNMTPQTSRSIKRTISDTIFNFEPRVKLHDVIVEEDYDNNLYKVSIRYYILNTNILAEMNLNLERLR